MGEQRIPCALTAIQFESPKSDDEMYVLRRRAWHEQDVAIIPSVGLTVDERRAVNSICNRLYGFKANLIKG